MTGIVSNLQRALGRNTSVLYSVTVIEVGTNISTEKHVALDSGHTC